MNWGRGLTCFSGGKLSMLGQWHWLQLLPWFLSFPALADTNAVTVALTPAMHQVVRQASGSERSALQRVIKTGNKFIKLRFSNEDGYDIETEDEWKKTVGPLMAMSGEEWQRISEQWTTIVEEAVQGKQISGGLLVCPRVELVEIKSTRDGTSLTYRAMLIGASFDLGAGRTRFFIDTRRSSKPYLTEIRIGKDARIREVNTPETVLAWVYAYRKDSIRRSIQISQDQQDSSYAEKLKEQLKRIDAAASICNSQK